MVRPRIKRSVYFNPEISYFKPAGVPLRDVGEVFLEPEGIEAMRLQSIDGLNQEEAAKRMNISQPTFNRIINEARKKVTDALINGKAIRIIKK